MPKAQDSGASVEETFLAFWNDERVKAMEAVCAEEGIAPAAFQRLVEDYQFTGKPPLREAVIDVLEQKPKILERKKITERIIDKLLGLDALLHAGDDDKTLIDDDAADAIPAPPAEPITKPGDIWALGKHRLCCGDATDTAAVARMLKGELATLMFTSPPYAQQRDYGAAKEKVGDWDALMQGVFTAAPVTAEAQLLVNLGLVHRDSEGSPIGKDGWNGCARLAGGDLVGMCGIRDRDCRATGTAAWPRRTSSSFTSTAARENRTRQSHPSTQAKLSAVVVFAGPTAPSTPRPGPATRSKATASLTAYSGLCDTRVGWVLPDRIRRCSLWRWSRPC